MYKRQLHLWRCLSEVYFRSRADVSLCALPLSSSNPPPSPFSSYLSSVCLAGGADGFIAKLPPAGVLTGIKILPYKRGQRTREDNFSQLRDEFSRSDSLKEKRVDGWGSDRWPAPARPRNGGVPSTARPSHLGGRASGTGPDKEKSESGDEIGIWLATMKGGHLRRPQKVGRSEAQI